MDDDDSEWGVRRAIRDFYANGYVWGSDVEVTRYYTNDAYETQTEDD